MTYTKTQYTRTVEAHRITCDTCGHVVRQGYESDHDIIHEQITPEKHGYRYVTSGDLFEYRKGGDLGSPFVRRKPEDVPDREHKSMFIDEQMGIRRYKNIIFSGEGWYGQVEVTDRDGDTDYEWHHVSKIAAKMDEEWRELANQIAIINRLGGKP